MNSVGIVGVGHYAPPHIVKNDDFVARGLDTSDEWIRERTGISERRIADADMATSDLAAAAAKNALGRSSISEREIDLIVLATSTPDYLAFPSTAALVQKKIGAPPVGSFDVSAACSGFNYAITVGAQFVATGAAKKVLVVAADCLSRIVNWEDRRTCVLFGDGAGAVILGQVKNGYGILYSELFADGAYYDLIYVPEGGSRSALSCESIRGQRHKIEMDGKRLFKIAVTTLEVAVVSALEKAGLKPDDVRYYVLHQANMRIIDGIRNRLGLDADRFLTNLAQFGNTSAASVPMVLAQADEAGKFTDGDVILTLGFGSGFTWGIDIIRWGGQL